MCYSSISSKTAIFTKYVPTLTSIIGLLVTSLASTLALQHHLDFCEPEVTTFEQEAGIWNSDGTFPSYY